MMFISIASIDNIVRMPILRTGILGVFRQQDEGEVSGSYSWR